MFHRVSQSGCCKYSLQDGFAGGSDSEVEILNVSIVTNGRRGGSVVKRDRSLKEISSHVRRPWQVLAECFNTFAAQKPELFPEHKQPLGISWYLLVFVSMIFCMVLYFGVSYLLLGVWYGRYDITMFYIGTKQNHFFHVWCADLI